MNKRSTTPFLSSCRQNISETRTKESLVTLNTIQQRCTYHRKTGKISLQECTSTGKSSKTISKKSFSLSQASSTRSSTMTQSFVNAYLILIGWVAAKSFILVSPKKYLTSTYKKWLTTVSKLLLSNKLKIRDSSKLDLKRKRTIKSKIYPSLTKSSTDKSVTW